SVLLLRRRTRLPRRRPPSHGLAAPTTAREAGASPGHERQHCPVLLRVPGKDLGRRGSGVEPRQRLPLLGGVSRDPPGGGTRLSGVGVPLVVRDLTVMGTAGQ